MDDRITLLSEPHKQCLRLAGQGFSSKEIAPEIGLTHRTVDQYLHEARQMLGARSRGEAARILREAESGGPLKKLQLKSEAVVEAPETAIVEEPTDGTATPKSRFGIPPIGGPSDDLTPTGALRLIVQLALMAAVGTAVLVLIYFWVMDLLVELAR